ncbi:MAG: LacI family DNA-binding transcriptional regulator [Ilumatobacter sp.]|uniref:LacI family DNA-binding transcriptional regulator n=1 Tax=Ilumatobacter sp. TaxID=1967498 RepID=UPI0026089031|nr:LacI family DNA-binding transcriptional regulator [Ilumatobacter sp.]MDJ0769696.1 LacI family DNA-binding transcriptional regulator [Ilumatobacter sp.]
MARSNRPTLRDVARAAGLSVTQVSRALNDHADVAPTTRERALRAARELGYTPNIAARRLKVPETHAHSIGLVLQPTTARLSDPFLGELLAWMVDEAGGHGFELLLSTPPGDEHPLAAYERSIQQKRVDGFVVLRTAADDERIAYLLEQSFPFVTFGRLPDQAGFPVVDEIDDSLQPAVDLLVELGHRHIACITEPTEHSKAIYRLRSFHRAMREHDLDVRVDDVVEAGFHVDSGYAAGCRLLDRDDPPTAVVALNDLLAMGVLRASDERGVRIPGDLSVVGFDDIDAAHLVTPALTTMHQPIEQAGRLLVRQVLTAIERGDGYDEQRLITPRLVVRASTGPPAP